MSNFTGKSAMFAASDQGNPKTPSASENEITPLKRISRYNLERIYLTDPQTFNTVNKSKQLIMSAGYKIAANQKQHQSKYDEFFESIGTIGLRMDDRQLLSAIFHDKLWCGNAYVERIYNQPENKIVDLKMIDPKLMDYARDKDDVIVVDEYQNPVGYVMFVGEGVVGDPTPQNVVLEPEHIFLSAFRIAHFRMFPYGNRFEAVGIIEPAYLDIERKHKIEDAAANSIHNTASYPIIGYVGDSQRSATPKTMKSTLTALQNLSHSRYMVFQHPTRVETLEVKHSDQIDSILRYFRGNQSSASGMALGFSVGTGEAVNRSCYSEDTLTLTKTGWKNYYDIKDGEEIANFDTKTNKIIFRPHKGLYVYDYNGEMINFKGRSEDILVTPDHKMWVAESRHKKFQIMKAEDIKYCRYKFKKNGDWKDWKDTHKDIIIPKLEYEKGQGKHNELYDKDVRINRKLFYEFLGYHLSEGGMSHTKGKYMITFAQKGKYEPDFKKCFEKMPFHFSKYYDAKDEITRWSVVDKRLWTYIKQSGNYCYDKKIIDVDKLSKIDVKILFNSMMKGDGHWDTTVYKAGTKGYYSTTSKQLAEDFIYLSTKLGYSSNYHLQTKRLKPHHHELYRVNLIKGRVELHHQNGITKEQYNGKVYCFQTDTGFFLTMRNGKVAIQGNTLSTQQRMLDISLESEAKNTVSEFNVLILDELARVNNYPCRAKLEWGNIAAEERTDKLGRLVSAVSSAIIAPEEARIDFLTSEDIDPIPEAYKKHTESTQAKPKKIPSKPFPGDEKSTADTKDSAEDSE